MRALRCAGCWPTQKYVSPAKTRINLHSYAVLPESLSAIVCEPRIQGVFDEDADHTTRIAQSNLSLPRFCLGLAVPWLIFKRVLETNSVSVSLIKFMIMQHFNVESD